MKLQGIYRILHASTDKSYIGQSVDIRSRWKTHRGDLNRGTHRNRHLQRAWDKYGPEAFEFEIMEFVPYRANLDAFENHYIRLYNACEDGYNLAEEARGPKSVSEETRRKKHEASMGEKNPFYGKRHTPETLTKLRGREFTEEHRKKMSAAARSRVVSPEAKARMSEAQTARRCNEAKTPVSDDTRQKLSKSSLGRRPSEETRRRMSVSQQARRDKGFPEEAREKFKTAWTPERRSAQAERLKLIKEKARNTLLRTAPGSSVPCKLT